MTREEFIEYYTNISATIDNEDYFTHMINSAWNLDGEAATYKKYAKGVAMDKTTPAPGGGMGGSSYTGF